MMRAAAVDIGTNSVRLLLADFSPTGMKPLLRDMCTTRLGSGLMQSGLLSAKGRETTKQAVRKFVSIAQAEGAARLKIFGTSALRLASNGPSFARELSRATGISVEILSEQQEAYYSYAGVMRSLTLSPETVVFDLGGGSCELVWRQESDLCWKSMRLGAVYLSDTYFLHDPPLPDEIAAARCRIKQAFEPLCMPKGYLAGVGGTVTSLAAMAMELKVYDSRLVHGYKLTRVQIQELLEKMLGCSTEERRKLPGLQPSRADIIHAGTLVIDELMEFCKTSGTIVSEEDLLAGSLFSSIS